jgi:O-antigen ligase
VLTRKAALQVIIGSVVCAAGMAVLLGYEHSQIGLGGVAFVLSWVAFCLMPWAVLPVSIIGGVVASGLLGQTDVRPIVIAHALLLSAGCIAVVTRRLVGADRERLSHPGYQLGMVAILMVAAVGALYGLAIGNAPKDVLIALYLVAVIPIYFLIAMQTLVRPSWRRYAGMTYVASISVLTLLEYGTPGRHGGLLALIPVPALVVLAGRYAGWRRSGLAALAAILSADVVLASYRSIWLAGGIAALILIVRGTRSVRIGLVATGAAGAALAGLTAIAGGVEQRAVTIGEAVVRSAGYRLPESGVGWDVFVSRPLFGAGLGQTTPDVYLPGFVVTDVGPVYHAFYVLLLANLGIVGLAAVILPIGRVFWRGLSRRDSMALPFAALTVGFLAAALVSGPTDGHWELGLLPALTLLTAQTTGPVPPAEAGETEASEREAVYVGDRS